MEFRTQEVLPRRFLVHVCGISAGSRDAFCCIFVASPLAHATLSGSSLWHLRKLMRRFLVLPELAPSVALSREVKELESDLERRRLAAVAAEEEVNKAGLAASLGLTWPLPKRGRGPPSRQRQYEEALCRAIDQGVLPEEIVTKVVPVWWKQGNPLVAAAEEMVLESCGAAEDGIEELDQPEDVEGAGPVKKRKLHRAPLEVKEWLVEFVEQKMHIGPSSTLTSASSAPRTRPTVRHVQSLCPDVFEQVREDTVRRWKGEFGEEKKLKFRMLVDDPRHFHPWR